MGKGGLKNPLDNPFFEKFYFHKIQQIRDVFIFKLRVLLRFYSKALGEKKFISIYK